MIENHHPFRPLIPVTPGMPDPTSGDFADLLIDDPAPETGDDQDAQRPDACVGCTYLPGPNTGVRVATDPACPVHAPTGE